MTQTMAGNGYLFQAGRLIARVRYQIHLSRDETGRSRVEGELRLPAGRASGAGEGRFLMHTEAGFSLPVTADLSRATDWIPFRRIDHEEGPGDLG